MKIVDWGKRITEVLEAMPGTSKELSDKTGLEMTAIQVSIKMLLKQKRCFQSTRWGGQFSYTFVYYEIQHWKHRQRRLEQQRKENA